VNPSRRRWAYALLAYVAVALALVGAILPLIPTVPFLLLAAWAASRGSDRLHRWLYDHPRFGQALIDWEQSHAISRRTKVVTVLLLAASWTIMYVRVGIPWLLAAMALLFAAVLAFVLTRAEP
jgi:uncharacterized protein